MEEKPKPYGYSKDKMASEALEAVSNVSPAKIFEHLVTEAAKVEFVLYAQDPNVTIKAEERGTRNGIAIRGGFYSRAGIRFAIRNRVILEDADRVHIPYTHFTVDIRYSGKQMPWEQVKPDFQKVTVLILTQKQFARLAEVAWNDNSET